MKSFIKKRKKLLKILGISLLVFSLPLVANAGLAANIASTITNVIAQIFRFFIGTLLNWMASLADVMLQYNINNLNDSNTLISEGWKITRDLANLGFVLAIIIIGFATIVQFKQYGVKKLLPKLIAAALIVNFSLAIATPIIGFSNTLTKFFLNPGNGGYQISGAIAGAFNPQKLVIGTSDNEVPAVDPDNQGSIGVGSALLIGVTNIIFTIVLTGLTTIVFGALAFMLLARYVVLTFLLVLAPIVWLAWVIPQLQSQFQNWWQSFLKWTFFAPAVSFFIYLTLVGAENIKNADFANSAAANFASSNAALGAILNQGIQMIVLAALMFAGLYAADKMGINGAKGAIGIAKSAGGWAKGWAKGKASSFAKRNAMRAVTYPVRRKGKESDKSLAGKAREMAGNRTGKFSRKAASWVAGQLTALEDKGKKGVASEYQKKMKGWSTERKLAKLPGASGPEKKELLKSLSKDGKINKINAKEHLTEDNKRLFENYGEKGAFKKIEKQLGMTLEMMEALKNDDTDTFYEEAEKFYGKLLKKDLKDIPLKDIFSGKEKLGIGKDKLEEASQMIAKAIAKTNKGLVSSIEPKLDSKGRDNFEAEYKAALTTLGDEKGLKRFKNVIANFEGGGGTYYKEGSEEGSSGEDKSGSSEEKSGKDKEGETKDK